MRRWLVITLLVAVTGAAVGWSHGGARTLPGTCAEAVVPFCGDPSWPDAGQR